MFLALGAPIVEMADHGLYAEKLKIPFVLSVPSVKVRVTVEVPRALFTGVIVIVQLGAVPPRTIPEFNNTDEFPEAFETDDEQFKEESTSEIVKEITEDVIFA